MDVTCESCRASYRVDDAKIPANGIKAKCPKCGHSFFLKKPEAAPEAASYVDEQAAIPVSDEGAPPPPPADAFAGFGSVPAPAPSADPFAQGFGGVPEGFGNTAQPFGDLGSGNQAPPNDPFAAGGIFGGGGFGAGGFDNPADGGQAPGISGMFTAKTAFEIRRTNGQEVGPFDMFHIKQMIYEQQLDGTESLCESSGNWVPITSIEELGEIFRLTGSSSAPAAPAPEAKPKGFTPHESAQKAQPVAAPMSPVPSKPAAAAPVAIDHGGGGRTLSERVLIAVEHLWALSKKKSFRVIFGTLGGVLLLAVLLLVFKPQIYHAFGWDKKIQADAVIVEGDRTLASGERGPLLGAQAKYREAVAKYPLGADGLARLAELDARILARDPVRLDLKAEAEASLAKAEAKSKDAESVLRARATFALAMHDVAGAEAAAKAAEAKISEKQPDPFLSGLLGDIAFEKGDMAAAEAAFGKTAGARGKAGIARIKLKAGDFAAAKAAADEAAKLEPDNGMAVALAAFAGAHAGGDAAAARKALRDVATNPLRFAQDRARAEYFLGVMSEEQGMPTAAVGHYRAAISLYPADAEALAAAKRVFQLRFPDKPVDTWIAAVSKIRGSTAMGKIQEGEAQFATHNWTGAMTPLHAATDEDTGSARAQLAFGRLETEIGGAETLKAKGFFEKALTIDPDYVDAAVELSRWKLAHNDAAGARESGEKALAIDPTRPEAYEVAAAAAIVLKDPAAAEKWLSTATELDPDDYATWMNLGEARRLSGDPMGAMDPLKKAAALKPDVAEPLIRLGSAYEDIGDLKQAGDAYAGANKVEPANVKVATRAGVVKVKNGEYLDGKKMLDAVLKAHPEIAEAHYNLGVAYQYTGEPDKAVDSYKQAIKRDFPDAYLAHFHLGEIFAAPGALVDKDQAREHLRAAVEKKPDFYQAHEELSKIALNGNEYDEAIKELKQVDESTAKMKPADRNPILQRVRLQQGKIAKAQNRTKEAKDDFEQVLRITAGKPESAEALFNLGELFRETDLAKAKSYYQKAVAANPAFAPSYKPLGYMAKDNGEECVAKKQWQKFLDLTTNADEKKEIGDEIQTLSCER